MSRQQRGSSFCCCLGFVLFHCDDNETYEYLRELVFCSGQGGLSRLTLVGATEGEERRLKFGGVLFYLLCLVVRNNNVQETLLLLVGMFFFRNGARFWSRRIYFLLPVVGFARGSVSSLPSANKTRRPLWSLLSVNTDFIFLFLPFSSFSFLFPIPIRLTTSSFPPSLPTPEKNQPGAFLPSFRIHYSLN